MVFDMYTNGELRIVIRKPKQAEAKPAVSMAAGGELLHTCLNFGRSGLSIYVFDCWKDFKCTLLIHYVHDDWGGLNVVATDYFDCAANSEQCCINVLAPLVLP